MGPRAASGYRRDGSDASARSLLDQAVQRAERFGARAEGSARTGAVTPEALLEAGRDLDADLIVISTRARAVEGQPFLGHGPEYLLEHAPQTVLAVIFPPEGEATS